MAYQFPSDVEKLIQEQMASGDYRSEDDLLRDALKALEVHRHMVISDDPEVIAGIRRGLDEMNQGLGRSFDAVDADLRAKHQIPRDA